MKKVCRVKDEVFQEAVVRLFEKQKRFKEIEVNFKHIKSECTSIIDEYFDENEIDKSVNVDVADGDSITKACIKVSKVKRTTVSFNVEKVERALGHEISSQVINKKYEVNDMLGLTMYLKSIGADPRIFKSFINVTKTVNVNELEKLNELGIIDECQLDGCFTVTNGEPYYKLKLGKGDVED